MGPEYIVPLIGATVAVAQLGGSAAQSIQAKKAQEESTQRLAAESAKRSSEEQHRKKKEEEALMRSKQSAEDLAKQSRALGRQGTLLSGPLGALEAPVTPGAKTLMGT